MSADTRIINLETKLMCLNSSLSSIKGQCSLLTEQIEQSEQKIITFDKKKELYTKSVELLNLVSEATKTKTKLGFEKIVTYALRFILNDSRYGLNLNFHRRGNLTELNFNLKTPNCKESLEILNATGGGILDIFSLALRVSLLSLVKPKIEGFLLLDEPFKMLSSNYLNNAEKFLHAINKKLNRQIILITHKTEFLNSENNLIKIDNYNEK